MTNILSLLFNGKKVEPLEVPDPKTVTTQRDRLIKELKKIDQSYQRIDKEGQKMKQQIETALAIAITTGGLSDE